ncbi:MAG: EAL domain-containing protein [Steroidobacteraceae bacterium]
MVAEGVETEQQLAAICELGCDLAQGYLYSKPLHAHPGAERERIAQGRLKTAPFQYSGVLSARPAMTAPIGIALVTAHANRGEDEDAPLIAAALRAHGVNATEVAWDDAGADWSRYRLALLRSTWDYTLRLPEFLGWITHAAAQTSLRNDPATVRWNVDKHYLADLAHAGVPVVDCQFVEPGESATAALHSFLARYPQRELVVKPAVSAGSRDTQRHGREEREAILAHIARLLDERRSVLLQPYLERIDQQGESGLLYFNGEFSHAIRKSPLLERGKPGARSLHAKERITPREPSAAERALAVQVLAALPFAVPLYARIDLIQGDDGQPRLLELELTEPSLFLKHGAGAAERCAAAVVARI